MNLSAHLSRFGALALAAFSLGSIGLFEASAQVTRPDLQKVAGTPLQGGAADDVEARCDFNGDGINDLLIADRSDGAKSIRVRLGLGAGTFATTTTDFSFSPSDPTSLAVGALTGEDARPDIAVAVSGSVRVISNAAGAGGAPLFSQAANLSAAGVTIKEVEVADLNGDGRGDIVATGEGLSSLNFIEGKVVVFLNSAAGFGMGTTLTSPGSSARRLALGDIDANGNVDIAVVNPMEGAIAVYLATGPGVFNSAPAKTQLAFEDRPSGIALGQIHGDAQLEVAVWRESPLNDGSDKYILGHTLLRHTGNGALASMAGNAYSSHNYSAYEGDIAIADLNFDGVADVIFTNPAQNCVVVNALAVDEDGVDIFSSELYEYTLSNSPKRISIAELNGDTATVGGATVPKLDLVAVVQPVSVDKCVDVFLNGVSGGGGGMLPKPTLTAVKSATDWVFTTTFPAALPAGATVKVQYSFDPENPAAWVDVPSGLMSPNNLRTSFTLRTANFPSGNVAFRAVATPGAGSSFQPRNSLATQTFTVVRKLDNYISEVTDLSQLRLGNPKGKGILGSPSNIGAITKSLDGPHGDFLWFALKSENIGDVVDTAKITGPASANGMLVNYFDPNFTDVTAAVTGGTYTHTLARKGLVFLLIRLRTSAALPLGTVRGFDFIARSTISTSISDLSRAEITVIRKPNVEFVYTTDDNGNDIVSTTGSLRFAIAKTSFSAGERKTTIKFELPFTAGTTPVVPIATDLPPIYRATRAVIDGYSQADYQEAVTGVRPAGPAVEIRGNGNGIGLRIQTSGCLVQGVRFSNFGTGLQISGKTILNEGVFATGNVVVGCAFEGNSATGVHLIERAFGNQIGDDTPAKANFFHSVKVGDEVRGNHGVSLFGQGVTKNRIQGNVLGSVSSTESVSGAEVSSGFNLAAITVNGGASGNLIGGRHTGEGNHIMGNIGGGLPEQFARGVEIVGPGTNSNSVQGNIFGKTPAGEMRLNLGDNVVIDLGASDNIIGGTDVGAGNLIMNSLKSGVSIRSTNASVCEGTRIEGNIIGGFLAAEGNGSAGVALGPKARGTQIGGAKPRAGNVIVGNGGGVSDGGGVVLVGASGNFIQGNQIGVDASDQVNGNSRGIFLFQANSNVIGSTAPLGANTIACNLTSGILLDASSQNQILGNRIGINHDATQGAPNLGSGIVIRNGSNSNRIGDTQPAAANLIAFNADNGIRVEGASIKNAIRGNKHGLDAQPPIDLVGGTEDSAGNTANDPADADTGANDLQNAPAILEVNVAGASTEIIGSFNSIPRNTANTDTNPPRYAIDVYVDGIYGLSIDLATDLQGDGVAIGSPVNRDSNGLFSISIPKKLTGRKISLTATRKHKVGHGFVEGSTSEFSNIVTP